MTADRARSVLVVEDERIVALDLQQTLAEMGYDAFATAATADEAMTAATQRRPDLVLMDIRIEGQRDGIETAGLLRSRFGVPVVYLTAHADEATVERAKKTEPFGYLMKPVKPAELRSVIEVSLYKHSIEQRLRERERWFSTTLWSIGEAVVAADLEGNISFMNPAAEALVGVAIDAAIGRPAREIVQLLDPKQPRSPLDHVLMRRQRLVIEEAPLKNPQHVERIISDSASPVMDADQLLGAVMVFRDVTHQRLRQRQLEVADRLASLGTMAAGVAHEVNNPLAVVVSNAVFVLEQLRREAGTGEAAAERLAEAMQAQIDLHAGATRIGKVISELQAFARPVQHGQRHADVRAATTWAVRATAHVLQDRARVVVDLAPEAAVKLDETRLSQVLVNLLLNAADAIAPGHFAANEVKVEARVEDAMVALSVSDTGPGIAPEVLPRVFEPFFTTKPIGAGTGLGLSVCHGIITSAGGRIDVATRPGAGTTVTCRLPRVLPETAADPLERRAAKGARLLVVDDEPTLLRATRRALREYDVVCVEEPRDALALLDRGEVFDLILSDMRMPNMSGKRFYEQLLASHPAHAARVVFMTGGAVDAELADFLAAGKSPCIEKPFAPDTLRALIDGVLRARAQH